MPLDCSARIALKNYAILIVFPFIGFYEIFLNLPFFLPCVSPMHNSPVYLEGWWPRYYNITYSAETINRPWWFWSPPRYERTKKNVLHEKDSIIKSCGAKPCSTVFWMLKKSNKTQTSEQIWPYFVLYCQELKKKPYTYLTIIGMFNIKIT